MEQPDPSSNNNTTTAAIPAVQRRTPVSPADHSTTHPPAPANTSCSVPSLRFPRPLGNRQLTNWVSASSPDIMSVGSSPPYEAGAEPLGDSIADLGYEFIGTDGESQPQSATGSFDQQVPELSDDVQSLGDTDTGTDADTNDVDTDSSDDERQHARLSRTPPQSASLGGSEADEDYDEQEEADLETMADQSLDHPTSLFTPEPVGAAEVSNALKHHDEQPQMLDARRRALLARQRLLQIREALSGDSHAKPSDLLQDEAKNKPNKTSAWLSATATRFAQGLRDPEYSMSRKLAAGFMLFLVVNLASLGFRYLATPAPGSGAMLHTVPVASVSSAVVSTITPSFVPTAAVSSTLSSASPFNALQTTASMTSLLSSPDSTNPLQLCSAELHSRNEILLKVPQHYKSSWLSKKSLMVSVSRGTQDISSQSVKISSVDDGLLIEVPLEEAHGILDVSVATTRKPKINEVFHINLGRHMIVDAFDAGKQIMKNWAQTVTDTVNGTTAWVEDACIPALDLVSKQVSDQTASVSDSVMQGMQGLKDASQAALAFPSRWTNQLVGSFKQTFPRHVVQERLFQAETELLRQALDMQGELSVSLLKAQLTSKLWWLKVQGKTDEYKRYQAAAGPFFQKKLAAVLEAQRVRAEQSKKDIQARRKLGRKQERREARRPFWATGQGNS